MTRNFPLRRGGNSPLIFVFIFIMAAAQLYASGRREGSGAVTLNDEWVLCITEFDAGVLPEDKVVVSSLVNRRIAASLNSISRRTRISPEYAYYEEYAWARRRSEAASALAARQEERSRQIFRGDAGWIYRQNIARIDADIERLKTSLEEIENNAPLINKEPVFRLTSHNLENTFPSPPAAGAEFRFCGGQGADAFLAGSIADFYGRYFLTIKLYTVYTQSYVWEDSVVFSLNEIDNAVDELIRRLQVVLSGNRPAAAVVRAQPQEALVLINRSFAGRGETAQTEYPPGMYTITASAPDYESLTFETEFSSGQLHDISIRLNPIDYGDIEIFGDPGSRVYLGALYSGTLDADSPLLLRLPINQTEYILMESSGPKAANLYSSFNTLESSLVFQTPAAPDFSQAFFLRGEIPIQSGRVDRDRRHYYWTWAGTWVTGIAAWLTYYSYIGANTAVRSQYSAEGEIDQGFYNDYVNMYNISMGSMIAMGAVTAYGIFRLVRFLYTADKSTMPAVRRQGSK